MTIADRRFSTVVLNQQRQEASRFKAEWRAGMKADAEKAFVALGGADTVHKSIVLDLAYEEYCLRRESSEDLNPDEFIERFSCIAISLRRQICIHDALSIRGVLGDPEDLPEWPEVGDVIAGFLLNEELGRGAFGHVFRANEINLRERQVVVKLAKQGQHEAQLLAHVPHDGVVPVYSVVHDEEWGLTVLCMPFISRATMLDVIDIVHNGQNIPVEAFSLARAARSVNCEDDTLMPRSEAGVSTTRGTFADAVTAFGFLAAEALRATHAKNIYHRDLKPSNILVDPAGRPMLIDFNLSSEPVGDVPLGGTLPYMAPEQLSSFSVAVSGHDDALAPGPQADVFSLGVCLFELLYGVHPFAPIPMDLTNVELAEYLQERHALGPRRVPNAESMVDSSLRKILGRCLDSDQRRRPQSAAELARLLKRSMTNSSRFLRFVRIHRRLASFTVLILSASLVCGGIWYAAWPNQKQQDRKAAEAAIQKEAYSEAADQLTALLDKTPEDAQLLLLRGNAHLKLDRYDVALIDYDRAWALEPAPALSTRIAYCHMQLRHYDVATEWYRRLLREFPDAAVVHNNLGYAYLQDSLFELAIEHFGRAIQLNDRFGTAQLNRADALFQQALIQRLPTPQQALTDIELASKNMIHTGESSLLACQMICNSEEPHFDNLRTYLSTAIGHGVSRQRLEADSMLRVMSSDREFRRALESASSSGSMTRSIRVIPPW